MFIAYGHHSCSTSFVSLIALFEPVWIMIMKASGAVARLVGWSHIAKVLSVVSVFLQEHHRSKSPAGTPVQYSSGI